MINSYTVFFVVLMANSQGKKFTLPDTLLEYCPYTSFCENSASQVFPKAYSQQYTPCCQPCSCSETCGFYKKCCHRDFDNFTKDKNKNKQLVCLSASTYDLYFTSYYEMVDKCYGKIKGYDNLNKHEGSIFDSKFHPVYSPSKQLSYINEMYAHCNNVTDGINWQQTVACASESTFSDFTENIINGKVLIDASEMCILKYLPPKGFDLTPSKCEPDVIRTCNMSGLVYERDISWDLCTEFNATFIVGLKSEIQRYGNIFCWLCNQVRSENETLSIKSICSAAMVAGEEYKHLTRLPLTAVLDTIGKEPTHVPQRNGGQCSPNEVFLTSLQNSCRPRKCPFGQIMLNNNCNFYSRQWYGGPFSFLLKLTPLNNETIPMVFFSNMSAGYRSDSSADWLRRGSLKDWHVVPLFRTTADQTAERYLITKVTYPQSSSSVDPSYLHDVIKQAQKETWMLKNGKEQYRLKVALNEVLKYNPVERDSLLQSGINIITNQSFVFRANYLTRYMTLYDEFLMFFDSVPKEIFETGVFLSQLFFCDQIDLLPEEYEYLYATILFKVTNKTIYDANFRNVMTELYQFNSSENVSDKSKQIPTVRICLDEFPDHHSRLDSSCRIFWSCNPILFVIITFLLNLSVKFV